MENGTEKKETQKPDIKLDIDIPNHAFAHCPRYQFKLRQVARCVGCEHFRGLSTALETVQGDKKIPFETQYRLVCDHLVHRVILKLDISED